MVQKLMRAIKNGIKRFSVWFRGRTSWHRAPLSNAPLAHAAVRFAVLFLASFSLAFMLFAGFFALKANATLGVITQRITSFLGIAASDFPQVNPEEKNRLDILLLGIRGETDPNGGLLTDTIIVVSVDTKTYRAAVISVPRDTYVRFPILDISRKLNEAYEIGEQRQPNGGGIALAKLAVSEVLGINIDYAVVVNFDAFRETVDLLGGIDVNVARPLRENLQWGGVDFIIEKGLQHMDGETALRYARSRFTTSDFDRARRQQEVLVAIKNKAISLGFVSNPKKVTGFLEVIDRNVKTDIPANEIPDLVSLARKVDAARLVLKVLDTSENLLIAGQSNEGAYILLPAGGTFDAIHEIAQTLLVSY